MVTSQAAQQLLTQGGIIAVLAAFGAGLLSVLTPCVYPLIPITLALCGASRDAPRRQAFVRALTYVSGIVVSFTALGLVSAYTGRLFGSSLSHPAVALGGALIGVLLALFTLELISIPGIANIQRKLARSVVALPGSFLNGCGK